ncbi:hypothetical protein KUCAC02_029106, partial [Chaenocephalus aceratus]
MFIYPAFLRHGTRCAGEVAAAANNSHCIVGIAYNAKIGGVRMLDGDVTDMVEAKQAFENGIRMGRKGRGSIFVWASGNGGAQQRPLLLRRLHQLHLHHLHLQHSRERTQTLVPGGVLVHTDHHLQQRGELRPKIITTDLRHRCTDSHTGTSASAPMAAAIIALALEANARLSWRDVQHIIVKTSRAGHLSAPDWKTNAAGYNVSHLYGFGLMDAEAMVMEAERWTHVPSQHVCVETADRQIRTIRPEHVVRSVYKATGCNDNPNHHVIYLEHVVVRITITHPRRGDLSINLTSPSGTKSQLLANRLFDHSMEGFKNWEFMTTHCWGEKAAGDWVLEIYDSPSQLRSQKVPGKLKEWVPGARQDPLRRDGGAHRGGAHEEYIGPCDSEMQRERCEGPGPITASTASTTSSSSRQTPGLCVSECPSGFFRDDRKRCKKCSSLCETCVGSVATSAPHAGLVSTSTRASNTCVASCGDGFYLDLDSNICRRCPENCKRSALPSISAQNVKPGMSLQGNKCQMTCDPGLITTATGGLVSPVIGHVPPAQAQSRPQTAGSCRGPVRSVTIAATSAWGPGRGNCSSCVSGYNLEAGACVVSTICKDGQYMSPHGSCHFCSVTCLQCTGPEREDCSSCPATRLFDDGSCVIRCQLGRYAMERQCHLCHHTCKECTDQGPEHCTSCDTDKFNVARYLFHNQCRDVCPEGFFHSRWRRCEACPADCIICSSADHCLHCGPGHQLRDSKCVPLECSAGQVADADAEDCVPCDVGCKQCERKVSKDEARGTVCLKCEDGYYQLGSDCHQSCPDRTYNEKDSMVCAPCDDKQCVICDPSQCYWCEEGFYVSDDKCVDHCKEGFYVDEESRECEPCHRACRTCGGPQYDDCDSCEEELTLKNGECLESRQLASCPEKQFRNSQGECEVCHSSCKTCSAEGKEDCNSCYS